MALTFARLQELLKREGLLYYVAPDRPVVRMGFNGTFGQYEIVILLEMDREFLQFRALNYLNCPAESPHLSCVLGVLGALNGRVRFVKLAWDPQDGEIVAFGDLWVMDGTVTERQFNRLCSNFIPSIDLAYRRIKTAIETGRDPGEMSPAEMLAGLGRGSKGPPRDPGSPGPRSVIREI
jgi:hypothetical protein